MVRLSCWSDEWKINIILKYFNILWIFHAHSAAHTLVGNSRVLDKMGHWPQGSQCISKRITLTLAFNDENKYTFQNSQRKPHSARNSRATSTALSWTLYVRSCYTFLKHYPHIYMIFRVHFLHFCFSNEVYTKKLQRKMLIFCQSRHSLPLQWSRSSISKDKRNAELDFLREVWLFLGRESRVPQIYLFVTWLIFHLHFISKYKCKRQSTTNTKLK